MNSSPKFRLNMSCLFYVSKPQVATIRNFFFASISNGGYHFLIFSRGGLAIHSYN